MATAPQIRLNPDLNPSDYAVEYAKNGVVRVPDIFEPETAEAMFSVLAQKTPWRLVYSNAEGKEVLLTEKELQAMGGEAFNKLLQALYERARDGFAYIYRVYPMLDAYLAGWDPGHPLHSLLEFLNSAPYLNFVREITAESSVIKVDAQATLYNPGHFLTSHDDSGEEKERRAAYTLGFSRGWKPDWGGALVFYDEEDANKIINSLLPGWNVLSIFKVPRPHTVNYVTPFAGVGRYSITGWLRDDPAKN